MGVAYTLLGAVHYTFAGFGLLGIVALLAERPALRHWLAALGVIAGMSAAGAGLISGIGALNWLGVLVLAVFGVLPTAWALVVEAREGGPRVQARVRHAALVAAACGLVLGVSMGVVSASAEMFGFAFVGIEAMVRTHGALNALAIIVATLALAAGGVGRRDGRGAGER